MEYENAVMLSRPQATSLMQHPRVIGFLCESGAYAFCDVSNPARRKLPANFIGLPIASIRQVQTNEVLKAFLSGADGVLIAGCKTCQQQYPDDSVSEILQALTDSGIGRRRLRLEWISADDEERFFSIIHAMMENLRQLPPLRLSIALRNHIIYCG